MPKPTKLFRIQPDRAAELVACLKSCVDEVEAPVMDELTGRIRGGGSPAIMVRVSDDAARRPRHAPLLDIAQGLVAPNGIEGHALVLALRGRLTSLRGLASLAALDDLTEVHFDHAEPEPQAWEDLGSLAALANVHTLRLALKLSDTPATMSGLSALPGLRSLIATFHGGHHLPRFGRLPGLLSADISITECADIGPLEAFPGLQRLELHIGPGSELRDLTVLASMPELRSFELGAVASHHRWWHRVDDLSPLASCRKLVTLRLPDCRLVSDLAPLAGLHELEDLDLGGCERVRDVSPLAALPRLSTLTWSVAGTARAPTVSGFPQLTTLTVRARQHSHHLGRVNELRVEGCPQLHTLFLVGNLEGLQLEHLPNLALLYLRGNPRLTAVESESGLPALREVDVRECPSLDDLSGRTWARNVQVMGGSLPAVPSPEHSGMNDDDPSPVVAPSDAATGREFSLDSETAAAVRDALSEVDGRWSLVVRAKPSEPAWPSHLEHLEHLERRDSAWIQLLSSESDQRPSTPVRGQDVWLVYRDTERLGDVPSVAHLVGLFGVAVRLSWTLRSLSELDGAQGISVLSLEDCDALDDITAVGGLASLRQLSIWNCGSLQDFAPLGRLDRLTHLEISSFLGSLGRPMRLSDISFAGSLRDLRWLDIALCPALADLAPIQGLPALETVRIEGQEWRPV